MSRKSSGVSRRKFLAGTIGGLVVGAVAGFGGSMVMRPPPPAEVVPEKVQIRYLDMESTAGREGLVDEFEQENPDVDLLYESVPFAEGRTKYLTLIEAGEPPDIGYVVPADVPEYEAKGALRTIDEFLTDSLKRMFVSDAVLKGAYFKNQYWGLPMLHSVRLLYYRKDWFEEEGIDPNFKTVPDLIEVAKQVHDPGRERYGFSYTASSEFPRVPSFNFKQFIWAAGGQEYDEDGKCAVGGSEGVQAMEWLKELSQYMIPGVTGAIEGDQERAFTTGTAAMVVMWPGIGMKSEAGEIPLSPDQIGINSDMMPVPLSITDVTCIFKQSKHPEVAFRLAVYFQRLKWRMAMDQLWGMLPLTVEESRDPYYTETWYFSEFMKAEPRARSTALSPVNPILDIELTNAMQAVILGEAEPKEAMERAAEAVNREL